MKPLLLLLACCLAVRTARAIDQIGGAFGPKFGEMFEPTAAPVGDRFGMNIFDGAYEFKPDRPNAAFSNYFVWISPTSHRIYRIAAVGVTSDFERRKQARTKIVAVLRAKYSDEPAESGQISQYHKFISVDDFTQKGAEPFGLLVDYRDQDIADVSQTEANETHRAELARRQRKLTRGTDATGL